MSKFSRESKDTISFGVRVGYVLFLLAGLFSPVFAGTHYEVPVVVVSPLNSTTARGSDSLRQRPIEVRLVKHVRIGKGRTIPAGALINGHVFRTTRNGITVYFNTIETQQGRWLLKRASVVSKHGLARVVRGQKHFYVQTSMREVVVGGGAACRIGPSLAVHEPKPILDAAARLNRPPISWDWDFRSQMRPPKVGHNDGASLLIHLAGRNEDPLDLRKDDRLQLRVEGFQLQQNVTNVSGI